MKSIQSKDPYNHPSSHPFIPPFNSFRLSGIWSWLQQAKQGIQHFPAPAGGSQDGLGSGAQETSSELLALSLKLNSATQQKKLICMCNLILSVTD